LFATGGPGFIAGARLFQRTVGFNVGARAILRMGGAGIRGGGALDLRSAGLGTGGATLWSGDAFSFATAGIGVGADRGFGFGSATIAGFCGGGSIAAGSAYVSTIFGSREAARVVVKCSGKL